MAEIAETRPRLSLAQLFIIFFKAGCGFGGGLGVLALLQEQLVTLRRTQRREIGVQCFVLRYELRVHLAERCPCDLVLRKVSSVPTPVEGLRQSRRKPNEQTAA